MPENTLIQLGAVAVLFAIAIREFFGYLKAKKTVGNGENLNPKILKELQSMNDNHLCSIKDAVVDGNKEVVAAVNEGNLKMAEFIGEMRGRLK